MDFCFLKARRSIAAAGGLALMLAAAGSPVAKAQDAAAQPAGQGGATTKNYKDRAEYDLYAKIAQTQDPKARLELLNTWQTKYPQTDYSTERLQYFVATLGQLAGTDPAQRQPLIDKCTEALKADPKNFTANYYVALWGPVVGGASPSSDLLSQVDTGAHGVIDGADANFPAAKKPASMNDEDWAKAKNQVIAVAHNALAWEATSKKDNATADSEYKASLTANPNQGRISAVYGKLLIEEKKYPDALFEYARAGEYDGPDSVPAAQRPQLLDYFNKTYSNYHGGADGADQILTQAKTSAVPPSGLAITSASDLANKQADATNQRIASDPAFKIWYAVKASLQDKGDSFFNADVKGVEIPGGAEGVQNFSGTVISLDPADRPTKVVVGVEDPTKPDATLVFSQPLPPEALQKIQAGQKLEFTGVAEAYTKDPYMLTFTDPTVPGVKTTAPAKTGRKRR